MTPCVLELRGKKLTLVHASANVKTAARGQGRVCATWRRPFREFYGGSGRAIVGESDAADRYIAATVLVDVFRVSPIM